MRNKYRSTNVSDLKEEWNNIKVRVRPQLIWVGIKFPVTLYKQSEGKESECVCVWQPSGTFLIIIIIILNVDQAKSQWEDGVAVLSF